MQPKLTVNITPELALAIEAGVKEGLKSLSPGEDFRKLAASDRSLKNLSIDMTLEIDEVTIGHDTDRAPSFSPPALPAFALLVRKYNIPEAEIRDLLTQAQNMDSTAVKDLLASTGVKVATEHLKVDVLAKASRIPVAKPVKASGAVLSITGITQK